LIVETNGLTKAFGEIRAVDEMSVAIPEGAIGLVGPNGAGKTTFIRLLLGLLRPDAGTGRVLGFDLQEGIPLRERIGYMPEHDCLLPEMTGVAFVAYMGRISGLDKNTALSRAHDVLQFVGVEEERYRKIAEYSTGMRQKIKLAQAMVHDPTLYIFDEPTTGLDPRGRTDMLRLLQTITKMPDRNVFLSSHLLPDVETICEYVVIVDGGRQVAAGKITDLLAGPQARLRVDIRGNRDAVAANLKAAGLDVDVGPTALRVARRPGVETDVFRAAKAAGAEVRYLGAEIRSLEELFLELVARDAEVR
jgi:ABC-2 type transport system ATP-binding protein